MRLFHLALAWCFLSALATFSPADEPPGKDPPTEAKKVSDEEINRLITQLGDDDFAKRLQARKQLEAIGEPALGSLKKAAANSDDPEVRRAAKTVIEVLEGKASGLLHVFGGHAGRVNGVTISADGKRAISASWDGSLRYWDLEKGELIRQTSGSRFAAMGVALSPDGKRVLSGSADQRMRLWDLETGALVRVYQGHHHTVWDVAFSPDGKQALSGCSDSYTRLWDVESGQELLKLQTSKGGRAWTVAFTADGKQAVAGGGNAFEKSDGPAASLLLWDLTTGKEIRKFEGHTKDIRHVAISPDGKQLLSASFDGTMRLWDMATAKEIKRFDGPGNFVESASFTPDGKRAVCSYGPRILEAVFEDDPRCSIRLWDLATGKELKQFKGHAGPVLCLAVSPDGRTLLSGSADGTMRSWQMPK